ncbi:MAG: hypothetical protein GYA59_09440 [Chloroflexi bacterium]|nr:hypothetical protein [Chloroflexota bacterium]
MNQPETKKRSTVWIWVIVVIAIVLACCCCAVAVGGGLVYLGTQDQDWGAMFTNELEDLQGNAVPTLSPVITAEARANTPIPVEPTLPASPTVASVPPRVVANQLLVSTGLGVWAVDEVTHDAVRLSYDQMNVSDHLQKGLSPDKKAFAYFTGFGGASLNPILMVLDVENQSTILQLELTGPLSQAGLETPGEPAFEATQAMQFTDSLAWSPDGQYLAFVAARDSDNADVYLLDRSDASVTRLSDEAGNAASLHWSADGQFIEYMSVNSFGTGAGFSMEGLWVYDVGSQQVRQLEKVESSGEEFLGWMDARTFLITSWGAMCETYNLRAVNVASGDQDVLVDGCFTGIAFNPEQKSGMLSVTEFNQEYCDCGQALDPGLYTFGTDPLKKFEPLPAYSIGFVPEGQLFTIFGDEGLQAIYDANGAAVNILPEVKGLKPYPAPTGDFWAWASYYSGKTGLWVTQNNADPIELSSLATSEPVWSRDGQTIYYVENNQLFSASAPDFSATLLLEVPNAEMLGVTH